MTEILRDHPPPSLPSAAFLSKCQLVQPGFGGSNKSHPLASISKCRAPIFNLAGYAKNSPERHYI